MGLGSGDQPLACPNCHSGYGDFRRGRSRRGRGKRQACSRRPRSRAGARRAQKRSVPIRRLPRAGASAAQPTYPGEGCRAEPDATRQDVPGHPANLEGTIFHTEQGAYLAGFVAARMADRLPPPHVVSSVGGVDIPTVDAFIAGFEAGAKRADPKIKLLRAFTNTFTTPAPCANAARAQIDQGSKVVFNVAGACGLGALKTAQRRGVYGIGVDIDQSTLGHFILTSVVKNLDLAVYDLAKRVVRGRLRTGGNLSFDLNNHGVYLGQFSPKVRPSIQRQLIPLARQIEQGKIHVPSMLSPPG